VARDREHVVQLGLSAWEKARELKAKGRIGFAAVKYTNSAGRFLSYLQLAGNIDVRPVRHAFSTMSREAAAMLDRPGTEQASIDFARMALATAYLADPTAGDSARIRTLLLDKSRPPMFQRVLTGERPVLSMATVIGGSAAARLLLADLLSKHRGLPEPRDPRWPIGSGGRVSYWKDKKRYHRAVLPSCAAMSTEAEMRQLATEAVLIYSELCESAEGFESARRLAADALGRIDRVAG
jgi:hypothetical protein